MPIITKTAHALDDSDLGRLLTWASPAEEGEMKTTTIRLGQIQHYEQSKEFPAGMTLVADEHTEETYYSLPAELPVSVDDETMRYVRVFFEGRPGSVLYIDGKLWSGLVDDQATQRKIEDLLGVRRIRVSGSAALPYAPDDFSDLPLIDDDNDEEEGDNE